MTVAVHQISILQSKNNILSAKIVPSVVIAEKEQHSLFEFKNTFRQNNTYI